MLLEGFAIGEPLEGGCQRQRKQNPRPGVRAARPDTRTICPIRNGVASSTRHSRMGSRRRRRVDMAEAYIVAAARTAGGRRGGRLAGWHPVDLAAQVLDALVQRSKADPALVEDVIMGCVMQVGEQAANVARNAVL